MRFEVQTRTLAGWENTWTEGGKLQTFGSERMAKSELEEFLADVRAAAKAGDMAEEYDRNDFRVVQSEVEGDEE